MPDTKPHDPDAIIRNVLARYQKGSGLSRSGMARAILVVDENVSALGPALRDANFRVVLPRSGMSDATIREELLAHRILITNNTKDFLDDAPVFEYGIIGLEALPFIDPASTYRDNQTVQLISKAISSYRLISKRTGFILMLRPDGKHTFRALD